MIFEPRIGNKELAQLCRRLATSMEAGIDARRTWSREAGGRGSPALRLRLGRISDAVSRGQSVSDALEETGGFFPLLFRQMTHVGEQTGQLAEVYRQLAEHYDHQVTLRRTFMAALTMPMLQLGMAVGIIGLLIWVMGLLPTGIDGEPIDILGLGLVGTPGLLIYLLFIGTVAGALLVLYQAIRRGMMWTRPIQRLLMQLPWIGGCLQTLSLSRLAWSLHLTLETGMDLRHALPLSLSSTHNARYTDYTDQIVHRVAHGEEIYLALAETGVFPRDFLDTLEVGERSGRLSESMVLLSQQYQEQARRALATMTILAGFAVWGLVAMLIIAMIFRLAFFYLNTINSFL